MVDPSPRASQNVNDVHAREAAAASTLSETGKYFALARGGSTMALGDLLSQCRNYLLMIANQAIKEGLKSKVGASDLVQETFLEAHRIFARFEGETEDELRWWLTQILEHKIGDAMKRYYGSASRDVRREFNWQQVYDDAVWDCLPTSSEKSASSVLRTSEDRHRFQQAFAQLPFDQQHVIQLRIDSNLGFDEIGQKMSRSADAARKLFSRAVLRLQGVLDNRAR